MKLSVTQWAYLAGIMDGEGSWSIARASDGKTQYRSSQRLHRLAVED